MLGRPSSFAQVAGHVTAHDGLTTLLRRLTDKYERPSQPTGAFCYVLAFIAVPALHREADSDSLRPERHKANQ